MSDVWCQLGLLLLSLTFSVCSVSATKQGHWQQVLDTLWCWIGDLHTTGDDESSAFVRILFRTTRWSTSAFLLVLTCLVCDHGLLFWLFLPQAEEESRLDALGPQEKKEKKEKKDKSKWVEERLLASQKEPVLCKLQPLQPLQPALAVSPHGLGFALSLLGRAGLGESYAVTGAGLVTIHGKCQRLDQNGSKWFVPHSSLVCLVKLWVECAPTYSRPNHGPGAL